jgi:hypothetical protein
MMQVIQTLGYVNISFGYIWVVEVDIDRGSYKPPRRKTTASALWHLWITVAWRV